MSGIATSESTPHAQAYQAILPGVEQRVAVGGSSVQSSAFQQATSIIRLYSTTDCFISIGTNPTAASATSLFLPAGTVEYFGVAESGGSKKLAVIQSSISGNLYITEGA